jgi:hypothetical protein
MTLIEIKTSADTGPSLDAPRDHGKSTKHLSGIKASLAMTS